MTISAVKSNWLIISVFVISLCYSLFLISPVLLTISKTPPNHINMLVGHYFEDYYEYITFIKEGQNGHIILSNLWSPDDPSRFLVVWWPYSLIGFISYLLKIPLPVQIIYWLSSAIFSFIFFMLAFTTVCRLLPKEKKITLLFAFLFVLLSGDLFTVSFTPNLTFTPISYWYAIGSPFARFSNATPHHQLTQIILLLGLLFVCRKKQNFCLLKETAVLFIISLLLLSLSPPKLILFWLVAFTMKIIYSLSLSAVAAGGANEGFPSGASLALSSTRWSDSEAQLGKRKRQDRQIRIKSFLPFLFSILLTLPFALLLARQTSTSPSLIAVKIWDISHYYYPSFLDFAQNTGLLLLLAVLGLPFYFSQTLPSRILFFFVSFFSFLFILTPFFMPLLRLAGVHNLRFETASSYFFLATSSVLFINKLFKKAFLRYAVFTAVISFFLISLYANFKIMLKVPYNAGHLQFVPAPLYQGIKTLEKTNQVVLSTPSSSYSLLVTAITGEKVYLGRSIFTLNHEEKTQKAIAFYNLQMGEKEAKEFLEKEKIGYILLSPWEQDPQKLLSAYPFLKIFFQNNYLIIFSF